MELTCPCCKAHIPLEAALEDEHGRELVGMLAAMQPQLALPLVHYLGFFRPAKQQLGWGRALRLAREVVMLLPTPVDALVAGLEEANRALDEKRRQPAWKPLGNHNYLRRCLEGAQARAAAPQAQPQAAAAPVRSKAAAALVSLEGLKR